MKIALINPPACRIIRSEVPSAVRANVGALPPLGLLYIAAWLRRHTAHEVVVLDAVAGRMDERELELRLGELRPRLVGITAHTHTLVDVLRTAELAKRLDPSVHVTLGGPHAADFPEASAGLAPVDSVVPGEGEMTFTELAESLAAGTPLDAVPGLLFRRGEKIVATAPRAPLADLDALPFPDRTLVDRGAYRYLLSRDAVMTTMISSRGCPFACRFCNTPHGGWRARTPENVVDEMEECLALGLRDIHFVDDTFNLNPARVTAICEEILRRRLPVRWSFRGRVDRVEPGQLALLKKAGCYDIHYGVECATDEGLRLLDKGITVDQAREAFRLTRRAGIGTVAYLMIGCPHERTREDVLRTIAFACELDPDYALFNVLTPYPGTALYRDGVEKGLLDAGAWKEFAATPREDFRFKVWEEHLTERELFSLLDLAFKRFYFRPRFIARMLGTPQNLRVLLRRARAGLSSLLPERS